MQELVPGVHHWTTFHEGIGAEVHSYYLTGVQPALVIDPRVPAEGLDVFDARPPRHVLLTNRHHLRHAQRFAERFGAKIWCHHAGLQDLAGVEVTGFRHGEELPGGVLAVEIGALCPEETGFYLPQAGVLALGDSLTREDDVLCFVPDAYMGDAPEAVKHGLLQAFSRCLELDFDVLLLAHGEPLDSNGKEALRWFIEARGQPLHLRMESLEVRALDAQEVAGVVPLFLAQARARGLLQVRIVHGAGHREQREAVHAVLREEPSVDRFELTGASSAGRNATLVFLLPAEGA